MISKRPTSLSRRGFTLTELAIVLGVIGAILGAIWAAASMAYQNQAAQKAQAQIITIVHNIRALHANHPYFLNTSANDNQSVAMATAGVYPPDMLVPGGGTVSYNGGTYYNSPAASPWQTPVAIWESSLSSSTFRITYTGVSAGACTQIASGVIGNYSTDGPLSLITACSPPGTSLQTTTLDAVGISTACQANATSTCQSVEFDFNL